MTGSLISDLLEVVGKHPGKVATGAGIVAGVYWFCKGKKSKVTAKVNSVGVAVPKYTCTPEMMAENLKTAWKVQGIADSEEAKKAAELIDKLAGPKAFVKNRHSCFDWTPGADNIFSAHDWSPPARVRCEFWRKAAPPLLIEAAEDALKGWGGDKKSITHIVGVSATGWKEPGLAASLIEALELSPHTCKQDLFFNGCNSGVSGMRVAKDIVEAGTNRVVLVASVEVAFPFLDSQTHDINNAVSNMLFGDGAGAAIISSEGSWTMHDWGSYQVPGTHDKMKMTPGDKPGNDAYAVFLHENIGDYLKDTFLGKFGAMIMSKYVGIHGFKKPSMALHTGGKKILDGVTAGLTPVGWGSCASETYDALKIYGNTGSAAVFPVLKTVLAKEPRPPVVVMGFGPGITIEYGFLKWSA